VQRIQTKNLLVYGAGHVGARVAKSWRARFPDAEIYALTESSTRHNHLKECGLTPVLSKDNISKSFDNVLFAVPPKENYEELVARALNCWNENGRFVFTSSTSVFLEKSNGAVTERSKLDHESRLFASEKLVEQDGGCIIRLAGLYDDERGPHSYLRRTMKIRSSPNSFLNLIHTDDAAAACIRALQDGKASAHYLACDNKPIRQIDFAKLVVGEKWTQVEFGPEPDSGKQCDCSFTMSALDWEPKIIFKDYIREWSNGTTSR
jgi:hypothetical protein